MGFVHFKTILFLSLCLTALCQRFFFNFREPFFLLGLALLLSAIFFISSVDFFISGTAINMCFFVKILLVAFLISIMDCFSELIVHWNSFASHWAFLGLLSLMSYQASWGGFPFLHSPLLASTCTSLEEPYFLASSCFSCPYTSISAPSPYSCGKYSSTMPFFHLMKRSYAGLLWLAIFFLCLLTSDS